MNKIQKLREVKKEIRERVGELETKLFIQNDNAHFDIPKEPISQITLIN